MPAASSILPASTDILHRIRYILDRLRQWIETGTLFQNDDAEVFLDALSAHWATLVIMLKEVDEANTRNLEHPDHFNSPPNISEGGKH